MMPFSKNNPESKNPAKKKPVKVEVQEQDDEYLEDEMTGTRQEQEEDEEIEEEIESKETPLPTNTPSKFAQDEFEKQKAELEIERKIRELYEIERQMRTKRIRMKNDASLDGIMSEQELLILASELKYQINILVKFIQQKFKVPDKWFGEMFKFVEQGEKGYEFWVIESKK